MNRYMVVAKHPSGVTVRRWLDAPNEAGAKLAYINGLGELPKSLSLKVQLV